MLHRLCGPPSIPLSFTVAGVLPRWITYRFRLSTQPESQTDSDHRLRHGLPGYLILFAPHALVPQCQSLRSSLPSQLVFRVISMHFTATQPIPATSTLFKMNSIQPPLIVKRPTFKPDLFNPPTHPLNPINPDNACTLRITAAAGTELAGAYSINYRHNKTHPALFFADQKQFTTQRAVFLHAAWLGQASRPLPNIPYCCLP